MPKYFKTDDIDDVVYIAKRLGEYYRDKIEENKFDDNKKSADSRKIRQYEKLAEKFENHVDKLPNIKMRKQKRIDEVLDYFNYEFDDEDAKDKIKVANRKDRERRNK